MDYTVANPEGCPGCIAQVVILVDTNAQDCVYDGIPGLAPGASGSGTVSLTAPSAAGVYEVRSRGGLFFGCADAIAAYDGSATGNVIGTITVSTFSATITNVSIDGQGTEAVLVPNEPFVVTLDYNVTNSASCPTCIVQVVLGVDEDGQDCAYTGVPPVFPGVDGSASVTLMAPNAITEIEIRQKLTLQFTCEGGVSNYDAAPPTGSVLGTATVGFGAEISNVDIAGQGTSAAVAPGAEFDVSLDYTVWNSPGCPGCIAQLVLGFDGDGQDCAYNGIPSQFPGDSGSGTATLTAPTAAGTYEIRYKRTFQFTCADALNEYETEGPEDEVLGTITVGGFNSQISNVSINGGGSTVAVGVGADFSVSFDYVVWNSDGCPGCIAQLAVGVEGDAQDCAYNGIPGVAPGVSAKATLTLTAPEDVGTYDLLSGLYLTFSCADALTNYEASPPQRVFGTINVGQVATESSSWGSVKARF